MTSALFIDPTIEDKIKVYWLGTSYDFATGRSKQIDFNAVMDLQATSIMLSSQVEMHIIPVNVAVKIQFDYQETVDRLGGKHPLTDYLIQRWYNHLDGG